MKKTWAEKLEDRKNFPKIVRRDKRYQVLDYEKHLIAKSSHEENE